MCQQASHCDRLALPHLKILEMQFILQQVAALKGGGERPDDEDNDDEDCEGVLADCPEVEEWIFPLQHNPPSASPTPKYISTLQLMPNGDRTHHVYIDDSSV